jgi:hypothetical protein
MIVFQYDVSGNNIFINGDQVWGILQLGIEAVQLKFQLIGAWYILQRYPAFANDVGHISE